MPALGQREHMTGTAMTARCGEVALFPRRMQHFHEAMADGDTSLQAPTELDPRAAAKCGIVVIGHGKTASVLLAAARSIIPGEGLADVVAIDAGVGQTPELTERVCEAVESVDEGRGILLIVDLMGSSPCMCGLQHSEGHGFALVTGLNLAMLTKLALVDRRSSPRELAATCSESVHRSICVKVHDAQGLDAADSRSDSAMGAALASAPSE